MKVSIITVVYNNVDTIAASIQSVLQQDYQDIEYIVIDGQSSDGTVEVIQKYAPYIGRFISEKDKGLYDALNKGISLATGDVVGILHADDLFNSSNSVSQIVDAFRQENVDCVYGDLVYVDRNDAAKVIRTWKSGNFQPKKFLQGWMPPHPTFYVKQECFAQNGFYDTAFTCSADYELMLRYLYKNKLSVSYVDQILVRMRVGGISNGSLKSRWIANQEDVLAWKKNDIQPLPFTRLMKPLRKVCQFSFKNIGFNIATYFALIVPLLMLALFYSTLENLPQLEIALSAVFSWGIVTASIPAIIKIAEIKQLTDDPNGRSSHKSPTPTLGGIGIFAALLVSSTLWVSMNDVNKLQYILGAITLIFFTGLKDDILVIAPSKKFVAQLLASVIIIFGTDLQLESFYGILGIGMLSDWFSIPFTLFVFVLITNAFNLIDGIDGLASMLGIIAACFFGYWFFVAGYIDYSIVAFITVGALLAFIRYNFSEKQKIFLGDTGSMIIGLLVATMTLQFVKLNGQAAGKDYFMYNAPLIVISVLGIVLFDVLRVFILRLYRNQSPFYPDRSHIHHLLVDLNFSHKKSTLFLSMVNVLLILTAISSFSLLHPTAAFLVTILLFLGYLILCHQLQFSNPRIVRLFFIQYIRLINGRRIIKPLNRIL